MAAMLEVVEKLGVDAFVPGDSVSVPFCSHGRLRMNISCLLSDSVL